MKQMTEMLVMMLLYLIHNIFIDINHTFINC